MQPCVAFFACVLHQNILHLLRQFNYLIDCLRHLTACFLKDILTVEDTSIITADIVVWLYRHGQYLTVNGKLRPTFRECLC